MLVVPPLSAPLQPHWLYKLKSHIAAALSLSLSFILQMSAGCEPLGDFLSLSWASCLISLFFLPKAVIRQNLSLLLHSQNSPLTDTFFWGAGTPSHPPAQKGGASQAPKLCLKLPLGRKCSSPGSLLVHRNLWPILVWKLFCFSPLHEHAMVPKPKLRTCLCQCAL